MYKESKASEASFGNHGYSTVPNRRVDMNLTPHLDPPPAVYRGLRPLDPPPLQFIGGLRSLEPPTPAKMQILSTRLLGTAEYNGITLL